MSTMSIKYILITPWNMALTAMFEERSLGFIKLLVPSMKCGGRYHESDLPPFYLAQVPAITARYHPLYLLYITPNLALNPGGRGQYCSRPSNGGLDE